MIWTIAGILCGAAMLVRLLVRRREHQVWWVCATLAPITSLVGGAILGNEGRVNRVLQQPNIAILLTDLLTVVGSCSGLVFWHAVRREHPNPKIITAHVVVASGVALIMIAGWTAAPIHMITYPTFRDIPVSVAYGCFALMGVIYLAAYNLVALSNALQLLRSAPSHDPALRSPGLRAALYTVLPASAFAIIAVGLYAARLFVTSSATARKVYGVGDLFMLTSMIAWGIFCAVILTGPSVHARIRARRTVRELEPLWQRLCELHPSIALPATSSSIVIRDQRMVIEVSDGLSMTTLPAEARVQGDPVSAVVEELAVPTSSRACRAFDLLLRPLTDDQEEALYRTVARAYTARQGDPQRLADAGACLPAVSQTSMTP